MIILRKTELAHLYGNLRIFMGSLRIFIAGLAGGFQENEAIPRVVETGGWNEATRCFVCCKLFRDGCLACAWVDENGFCGKIRKNGEIDVNRLRFRKIDKRP